ncbi:MAG: CBS domain-containing protein [Bacteroidia bacterium]|nr:CBS domain-containing protein [Bacteroidia bacterium]
MKISASIFSDPENDIVTTLENLNTNHVDMVHLDCLDNLDVFKDIETIKQNSSLPIDLHIITDNAQKFYPQLETSEVDYVAFQYENLVDKKLKVPKPNNMKIGLAITSETDVAVFEDYKDDFDFVLLMATNPGKSGGTFDKVNFQKIRSFRRRYPDKKIHIDGGVNGEVSFILRNMGVFSAVSGSYLFNSSTISSAILNLKLNEIESHFLVKDFMLDLDESPTIKVNDLTLENVILSLNKGKLGFTIVNDETGKFKGIIGNADLRNGLLNHIDSLHSMDMMNLVNQDPLKVYENFSVNDLLKYIKDQTRPVMYLPVINDNNETVGSVHFLNLIKGEL